MTNIWKTVWCALALSTICAGSAQAQSFSLAVSGKADGDLAVAGHAYPLTVTNSDGSYSGARALTVSTTAPSGGVVPQLCSTATPGNCATVSACQDAEPSTPRNTDFAGGVANLCLVMPDVGTFSVSVADGSVTGTGPSLRTMPSYFDLVLPSPSIINRSELPFCAASAFSYIGEPVKAKFSLIARNEKGQQTANYSGAAFNTAITDTAHWTAYGTNASMGLRFVGAGYPAGLGADARIAVSSPSMSWSGGQGDFEVAVKLSRNTGGEGPYSGIAIGIAPQDDDGVTLKDFDLDADNNGGSERASVGTTTLRHGRLKIANAYGSDVLPLPVDVQAQTWDGTGFVNFTDDHCTPLDGGYFALAQVGTLPQPGTSAVGTGTLGSEGKGRIALTRPSPAITGKAMVAIRTRRDDATPPPPLLPGLESYLPGVGTGTFGVYKSGPVLYRRELHY